MKTTLLSLSHFGMGSMQTALAQNLQENGEKFVGHQ